MLARRSTTVIACTTTRLFERSKASRSTALPSYQGTGSVHSTPGRSTTGNWVYETQSVGAEWRNKGYTLRHARTVTRLRDCAHWGATNCWIYSIGHHGTAVGAGRPVWSNRKPCASSPLSQSSGQVFD